MKNLLLNILVLILVLLFSVPIQAQDNEIFIAVVKIDDNTCIAHTKEQYSILQTTVRLVNTLKRVKARKSIDQTEYKTRVSMLLNGAEAMGITIADTDK